MTTDAVGGVWRYSVDLCAQLARTGARVTLVCLGPAPSAAQRAQVAVVPRVTLLAYPEPLEWMPEPWEGVERAGRYLVALARELRPDVVHLNGFSHGALDFGAPKVVVGHSCALSWWQAVEGTAIPEHLSAYRKNVAGGLRGAQAVVAPTQAMLSCLQRHYRVAGGEVIFNGSASSRPFLGPAPTKEPLVLCAGRLWDRAKNVSGLSRAATRCSWPIMVAGAGEAPASVFALGELEPDVLRSWMRRAAIYALPARYEPFGLSALEAALEGAALVLGDIPSLREVWGDAALYVSPDDAHQLGSTLNRLAADTSLREELSRRSRERATRYTLEDQARRYQALYSRLLTHGGAQPLFGRLRKRTLRCKVS